MEPIRDLKTPEEFIQYYYNQIKDSLNIDDININRLGFIGFFFEMMGNVQFDIKQYFDNLFVEAFPVTSSNNENLLYHSEVYGYKPEFAIPSSINGMFKFDFTKLPIIPFNVSKREIIISDSEFPLTLNLKETFIDQEISIDYVLEPQYKLIFERIDAVNSFRITCEIKTEKEYETVSLISSSPFIKIIDFKQYKVEEYNYKLPKYTYGTYYPIEIKLTDNIYTLEVLVTEKNGIEKTYTLKSNKSFISSADEVVFYKVTPNNDLLLEFGSGINGKYLPYADVKIKLKLTKGEIGNISVNTTFPKFKLRILDFDEYNTPVNDTQEMSNNNSIISANITGSYGGKNAELNEVLRTNLIKHIQSRQNLMSEVDFENNLKSYFDICEILFKKTDIVDNIIYCYIPLYDRYLNPVNSLTTSVLRSEFELNKSEIGGNIYVYNPSVTIEGKNFICPFLFIYNSLTRLYEGFFVLENATFNYSEKKAIAPNMNFVLNLYLEVEFLINKTRIWLRSYSDIGRYEFKITSNALFFNNLLMNTFGDSFYVDYQNGLILKDSDFTVSLIYNDESLFEYKFNNIKSVYSFSQIIKLKPVKIDSIDYITNLPLIEKTAYSKEKKYYQEKILSNMQNLTISQNRMLSDEVQLRFLNSYYIDKKFVKDLILQYTVTPEIEVQSYFLPFKIELNMDFAKDLILSKSRNISDEVDDIILNITNYLINNQTGLNITFYKTKIIDIIHNNEFIKHALVTLKDAKGVVIPNSNFENNNNKSFIEKLNKADYLHYSPIYYWFDLNDIKYTLKAYD